MNIGKDLSARAFTLKRVPPSSRTRSFSLAPYPACRFALHNWSRL